MNKSFYFQHDYNAANDSKILFLRQQLGMEGYGLYWFILEQLAQAGGSLPLKIIPVLAMQSQTQETKLNAVVWNYELFVIDDKNFFSSRLNEHLALRKHLSDKGKQLEDKLNSTELAGLLLLGNEAHSHFFDSDEQAIKWLKSIVNK